jgi:hypothetical protein
MTTTTTIAVPTSYAALCTKFAELTQRIDDELGQAGNGAAIDYGATEQRVADALGEVERGLHARVLRASISTCRPSGCGATTTGGSAGARATTTRSRGRCA